jgi:hypothetical protein
MKNENLTFSKLWAILVEWDACIKWFKKCLFSWSTKAFYLTCWGEEWFGKNRGRGKPTGQLRFLIPNRRNLIQNFETLVPKWAFVKARNPSYRCSEKHRDSTVQPFSVGFLVLYTALYRGKVSKIWWHFSGEVEKIWTSSDCANVTETYWLLISGSRRILQAENC